jgi:hypothetical protein
LEWSREVGRREVTFGGESERMKKESEIEDGEEE